MQVSLIIDTLKFFISRFVPALSLLGVSIIYSRELSIEDYGIYQMVWTYLSICVVLTSFGIPKFILTHRNEVSFYRLFPVFILVLITFLLPISLFVFFFQKSLNSTVSIIFLVLLISQTFYFFQEAFLLKEYSGRKILIPNLVYSILILTVHIWVVYVIPFSLIWCFCGITAVSIIRNIIVWKIYTLKLPVYVEKGKSIEFFKSQLFLLGTNELLSVLSKWLDKLILIFILTPTDYGIYFNGTFELPIIGMVLMAFQMIISVHSSNQNEDEIVKMFKESSLLLSSILFPLFAWMFFYSSDIVLLLFGDKYKNSIQLFALSSLLLPMRICNYTVLLQLKNKANQILIGSVMDMILALALSLGLYPFLGMNGLVVAFLIATYIQAGYYLMQISKEYKVSINELLPIKSLLLRLIVVVLAAALVNYINLIYVPKFILGTFVLIMIFIFYSRDYLKSVVQRMVESTT